MNGLRYLYVEGKNDFHVIKNLLTKHGISSKDMLKDANQRQPGPIYIDGYGDDNNYTGRGIEELKVAFRKTLETDNNISAIGIVVDADSRENSVNRRWTAICNIAQSIGYGDFPTQPPVTGHITTLNRQTRPPLSLGVWIMPDNEREGMLEHFVSDLIPADNFLWKKAQTDVSLIPEPERLFAPTHTRKAEIHTWLAWQETPGRPMGIGMTAGWLNHQSPLAQTFVDWIRRLFAV